MMAENNRNDHLQQKVFIEGRHPCDWLARIVETTLKERKLIKRDLIGSVTEWTTDLI